MAEKPHRIAIAMSRYDRKRTDGLGADPDTAIYLEPLGGPLGGSFFLPHRVHQFSARFEAVYFSLWLRDRKLGENID